MPLASSHFFDGEVEGNDQLYILYRFFRVMCREMIVKIGPGCAVGDDLSGGRVMRYLSSHPASRRGR